MKILFLSPSVSRKLGGVFEAERFLTLELHRQGVGIEVAGLEDEHWGADRDRWLPLKPAVYPVKGPAGFGYSPALAESVLASDADALHLHALWMHPSVVARNWGRKTKRPYLVTPHGMLEPWALANSKWKKKVAGWMYERASLTGARCLQATNSRECADFRTYGLSNPVAVIPNGVDLPEQEPTALRHSSGPRNLLFLGRLHPKKGLPAALEAWKTARPADGGWRFVIAGWDQGGHEALLAERCTALGLHWVRTTVREFLEGQCEAEAEIVLTGPAFGADKSELLQAADAFILPSVSEGLPVAVLEAWSHRLPVVKTDACNLPDGFEDGAAIRIRPDVGSIAEGMMTLFELPESSLAEMGARGRALVEQRYTWERVAGMARATYEWVLGGGSPPPFVELTRPVVRVPR